MTNRWTEWGLRVPDPRMINLRRAAPARRPAGDGPAADIVRPFIMTGGRPRPLDERLRMETLLTSTAAALSAPLAFEHAHIVELCRRPLSVAEIAVELKVPVGVARVLIADLVTERLLVVHAQAVIGGRPSKELLERIRAGVHAL